MPLLYDDLRKYIRDLWWEDPTRYHHHPQNCNQDQHQHQHHLYSYFHRKLDVETVKHHLKSNLSLATMLSSLDPDKVDENIRITLEHLEIVGMVNTPLLNPVQTKRSLSFCSQY